MPPDRLLDMELDRARKAGREMPRSLSIGAMLEVPSLLFQMPALLKRVDFLSIGSNDLFQFLFASDRGNARLSERYDTISPPTLKVSDVDHRSVPRSRRSGQPVR